MPRGCVELSHNGFNGRLKLWLELERDVVQDCLAEVVGADGCAEITQPIVMTASQSWADIVHPTWRSWWQQRHVAVMIEYGQTGARIHDRLRRHLPNQRNTTTCHASPFGVTSPPVASYENEKSHFFYRLIIINQKVHSVEMQIHADSKGKVAVDDVTLWANCCTKCHGNTISRFHLIEQPTM